MRLLAAILSAPTDDPTARANDLKGLEKANSKLESLSKAVKASYEIMTNRRHAVPDTSFQYVFLAPEYYFSNRRYANDRFFSQAHKRHIISELSALAKAYPHLLLVPGTVLWTKKAFRPKVGAAPNAIPMRQMPSVSAARTIASKLYASYRHGLATNEADWPHKGIYDGQEAGFDLPLWYVHDAAKQQTLIAQNVAYILKDNSILKYQKIGNYEEVKGEQGSIVFASGSIVGTFTLGSVKYGIEICMDHALGVLDTLAPGYTPDVRIIISSWVDENKVSTQSSAVVLHASTQQPNYIKGASGWVEANTLPVRRPIGFGAKLIAVRDLKQHNCTVYDIDAPSIINTDRNNKLVSNNLASVQHIH